MSRPELEQWVTTQAEFGALVGVSQQSISALVTAGTLPSGQPFTVWLLAYCRGLREAAAGRDADSPLVFQRARLAAEQADRVQMANAVMRKQLAPASLLEEVLAHMSRQIVTIFDAIPGQLRTRCPDLPGEAMRLVEAELVRARGVAANVSLDDAGDVYDMDAAEAASIDGESPDE